MDVILCIVCYANLPIVGVDVLDDPHAQSSHQGKRDVEGAVPYRFCKKVQLESFNKSRKNKTTLMGGFIFFGAATQIRTGDLILTKDVLYQLSHSSEPLLL